MVHVSCFTNHWCERIVWTSVVNIGHFCKDFDVKVQAHKRYKTQILSCDKQLKQCRWYLVCLSFLSLTLFFSSNLQHMQFATHAICNTCNLQHLLFAKCAICNMFYWHHVQFATYIICNMCNLQHVQFATPEFCNKCNVKNTPISTMEGKRALPCE